MFFDRMNDETVAKYNRKYVLADAYFDTGIHYGWTFGQVVSVSKYVNVRYFKNNLKLSQFIEPSERNIHVYDTMKEPQARVGADLIEFRRLQLRRERRWIRSVSCYDRRNGTFSITLTQTSGAEDDVVIEGYIIGKRAGLKRMNAQDKPEPFKIDWSDVRSD